VSYAAVSGITHGANDLIEITARNAGRLRALAGAGRAQRT
jgi:hypothetical protein